MSVFGVQKEFSDVNTPKTSISASADPNSFKCTSIFSLFLCLQKDIQQTVW